MPDAAIVAACNGVTELLSARIDPAEAIPVSVFATNERVRTAEAANPKYRLKVYPDRYYEMNRTARKRVENAYQVAVVAIRKYTPPASSDATGRIPPEWVSECIAWVEENVYNLLNSEGVHLDETEEIGERFRPWTCETTIVYDADRLDHDKEFFSVVTVEYTETIRG